MRRSGLLALLGLALAAGGAAPAPALAVEAEGFGLSAVGFPSYFILEGDRGSAVTGQVMVSNPGGRSRSVRLAAVDVRTSATGGLAYAIRARFRVGRWIQLQQRVVRLAPGARVAVPFRVEIPRRARAGEHFAGIVAQDVAPPRTRTTDPRSQVRLRFVSRVAVAVVVRVPGATRRGLSFTGARFDIAPSGVRLMLGLRNRGNALIRRTSGRIAISQGGRRLLTAPVRIDSFVPETEIEFPVRWRSGAVRGSYRVRGLLEPQGAPPVRIDTEVNFGRRQGRQYREATGRTAQGGTPLWIYAALAGAVIGVIALGAAYLRMRRRLRAAA